MDPSAAHKPHRALRAARRRRWRRGDRRARLPRRSARPRRPPAQIEAATRPRAARPAPNEAAPRPTSAERRRSRAPRPSPSANAEQPAPPSAGARPPRTRRRAPAEPRAKPGGRRARAGPERAARAGHPVPRAPPRRRPQSEDAAARARPGAHALGWVHRAARASSSPGRRRSIPSVVDEIEKVLLTADIGVRTSQKLLEEIRSSLSRRELTDPDAVWAFLRRRSTEMLSLPAPPVDFGAAQAVRAARHRRQRQRQDDDDRQAGRASWPARARRSCWPRATRSAPPPPSSWRSGPDARRRTLVRGKEGADPSSVIFDGVKRAATEGFDVVIADTAGRLHTKTDLMQELQKVRRVVGKASPGAPHETWLVIDSTSGQNAIAQAQIFTEAMAGLRDRADQARRHRQGRRHPRHRRPAEDSRALRRRRREGSRTCAPSTPRSSSKRCSSRRSTRSGRARLGSVASRRTRRNARKFLVD